MSVPPASPSLHSLPRIMESSHMETIDDATPAMELARNLPALVTQLKALREDMERKSKLYDSLLLNTESNPTTSRATTPSNPMEMSQNGMRGSIFTPFANSQLDPRASQMTLEDLSALDAALDDVNYSNTMVSRQSSIMMRQQQQGYRYTQRRQNRPTYGHVPMGRIGPDNYTVMWVSGECGISLRNFSRKDNKVGAQIAVLQHADGVTTGISNCRLGDQLVSINDERVDKLRFREIVDKLKTTRRPISLGFTTNANVQTSPRGKKKNSSPSTSDRHSVSGGSHPMTNEFFDDDESSDIVHETIDHPGYGDPVSLVRNSSIGELAVPTVDRTTTTSVQSSTSTLSDDVEMWCREQEEMHSDIIVLLTETVMRCEKLQQENLDQLQNLMQLSGESPRPSDRSSVTSFHAETDKIIKTNNELDSLDTDAVAPAALTSPTTSPRA
ncbi:Hypothetical protein PHPALM_19880 [Phytophthora palmivora]|uniref:PDZ domain-containing protein n=1 Tax=Phytophthora palmivora TaxID=4796 RepID=A0A2P4XGC4_9STRA|nr:Hypothetical protein PHPALM_19880 [Phytophthora palmivora]